MITHTRFSSFAIFVAAALAASGGHAAIRLPASKAEMIALGRDHRTAWDLHKDFEKQANGGQRLKGEELPFLREFAPTPGTTHLVNEMVNDIRRVYTDGRGHVPEADRYPLYDGDSIGFWHGKRLVIHTNQLREGQYQRAQPECGDQVETVEIWEKVAFTFDRPASPPQPAGR